MSTLNPYKAPAVKPTHKTSFQIVLEAYVKRTDNKLDDQALAIVKTKLFS